MKQDGMTYIEDDMLFGLREWLRRLHPDSPAPRPRRKPVKAPNYWRGWRTSRTRRP